MLLRSFFKMTLNLLNQLARGGETCQISSSFYLLSDSLVVQKHAARHQMNAFVCVESELLKALNNSGIVSDGALVGDGGRTWVFDAVCQNKG